MRDARSEPGMTKQTTEHDETAGHDDPPVIPDLIGDLRAFGLAPGARRKDAKRMVKEALLTRGLPDRANEDLF